MAGTINVSRDLWDDPTFKDAEMSQREAWIWMIADASWKARKRRFGSFEVDLQRGQLAVSTRFLAKAWMWSEPRVRRYLELLENRRMITRATDAGVTVVTICKYSDYQNVPCVGDAAATQQPTQQRRTTDANENKGVIREEDKGSYDPLSDQADLALEPDELQPAVDAYNATAKEAGWPSIQMLTKKRTAALRARLKEVGGLEGWSAALAKARASPHLCGENDRGWTASFDFLTAQSSFAKLMEGNYDQRKPAADRRPLGGAYSGRGERPGGLVGAAMRSRIG